MERVQMFSSDAEMLAASERARETFKYFWRELTWELRRIVPGCPIKMVKVGFPVASPPPGAPSHEHMWVDEVGFDGARVVGILNNAPRWATGLAEGDRVEAPLGQVSDWLYTRDGRAYGGFTLHLIRDRMGPDERAAHDDAWGLDFGDTVALAPSAPDDEHPMSENMGPVYRKQLSADGSPARFVDESGWTQLHYFALGGSLAVVDALLEAGADPRAATPAGHTARDLAQAMGWPRVVARIDRALGVS